MIPRCEPATTGEIFQSESRCNRAPRLDEALLARKIAIKHADRDHASPNALGFRVCESARDHRERRPWIGETRYESLAEPPTSSHGNIFHNRSRPRMSRQDYPARHLQGRVATFPKRCSKVDPVSVGVLLRKERGLVSQRKAPEPGRLPSSRLQRYPALQGCDNVRKFSLANRLPIWTRVAVKFSPVTSSRGQKARIMARAATQQIGSADRNGG